MLQCGIISHGEEAVTAMRNEFRKALIFITIPFSSETLRAPHMPSSLP